MKTPGSLAWRIAVFLSPVVAWLCLENFLLPRELFAFRPWDVLVVNFLPASQLGPFMNGVSVDMVSTGYQDYMLRRPHPHKKRERFRVDRHGFRNPERPAPPKGYEVVLHGDSNFAGSFLDEPDTLGRVLEGQLGRPVYTVSNDVVWMEDNVMTTHPPKYFVTQFYPDLDPRGTRTWRFTFDRFETRPPRRFPVAVLVAWERFCKQPARNWIRARLGLTELPNQSAAFVSQGVEAKRQASETEEEALRKLEEQADRLHAKMKKAGTTCIFLFMPAPTERYRKYLTLVAHLKEKGYPVVDFFPTLEDPQGYPDDFGKPPIAIGLKKPWWRLRTGSEKRSGNSSVQRLLRAHKTLVLRENLEFAQTVLGWNGRLASLDFASKETASWGIRDWDELGREYFRLALRQPFPGGILYNLAASWYSGGKYWACLAALSILFWEKWFPCDDIQTHGKARANRYWLFGKAWVQAGFPRFGYGFLKKAVEIGGNFGQETLLIVWVAQQLRRPEEEIRTYSVLALPYNHRYPTEFCLGTVY